MKKNTKRLAHHSFFLLGTLIVVMATLLYAKLLLSQEVTKTPFPLATSVKEISLKGKDLIYASDPEGNWDIYSMNLDTKKITNLTQSPGDDLNPQIASDGATLVFYSNRSGRNQIYSLDRRHPEKAPIQLTNIPGRNYDPTYSPDGSLIAFKSTRDDDHGDIFLMRADGTQIENLTLSMNTSEEWKPAFTRDGGHIVFTSRADTQRNDPNTDDLYSYSLDTKEILRLTNNIVPDWFPSVNPVTDEIAFISMERPGQDDAIYSLKLDGTSRKRIQAMPGDNDDPVWGPEHSIVYINNELGTYIVYLMRADGSDTRPLLQTTADVLSPLLVDDLATQ